MGKSSLANTIFGETVFEMGHAENPGTSQCREATRLVNGTSVSIIDDRTSEEDLRNEITRCVVECSPGPHAFLILLKVERFTDPENEVITNIIVFIVFYHSLFLKKLSGMLCLPVTIFLKECRLKSFAGATTVYVSC